MNRGKEKVADEINLLFPGYRDLIRKTEPLSLSMIRKKLKKDEIIVDYLLSNQYTGGERKLYIFIITRDDLEFHESGLDSLFQENALILGSTADPETGSASANSSYLGYTTALNYMYTKLIEPVEELLADKKLIIIPDEEIGWLSFDSFIRNMPTDDQPDWENLDHLIRHYTFSYASSSSLVYGKSFRLKRGAELISFSPDYSKDTLAGETQEQLTGAANEIRSIYKRFGGSSFAGEHATKRAFLGSIANPGILHLAMHSRSDTTNSRYSYLLFDNEGDTASDNKLYNYEISISRVNSPMVVLSACNSGTGTLYYGEGLMSLARGFILAGASSVVKTAWAVNDEASSEIISVFYYHLADGKAKNEALRLAKLEYLKKAGPAYANPVYWAAYEIMGDNAPVTGKRFPVYLVLITLIVIIVPAVMLIYLKRRRIFADRSL